ncbi:MAG: TolC family protein [Neisseriaceae bacterium]|nr:TolC family protein [Neisseriaceae bacterium]
MKLQHKKNWCNPLNLNCNPRKWAMEVGLRTNLDVVQAQQAYLEAQQQLANAKYHYLISYLDLLNTTGVLDDKSQMFSIKK